MKRFATIVLCIMAVATMKAQTEVTAGIMRGKDYGVTYMLPQTEIIINVETTKHTYTPGELCRYAEQFLRMNNVSSEPSSYWSIDNISIELAGVPDKEKVYFVKMKEKTSAPMMELTEEGIIRSINMPFSGKKAPQQAVSQQPATNNNAITFDASSYLTEEILMANSSAKMAELIAKEIYEIRESKNALVRGESDNLPQDGAQLKLMLDNLNHQEQALMAMFIGNRTEEKKSHTIRFTPREVKNAIAFRFSTKLGMVENDNLAGAPAYITITDLKNPEIPVATPEEEGSKKKEKTLSGIVYNVPGRAHIALTYNNQVIFEDEQPVSQFGGIEYLSPVLFNKNSGTQVLFDTATGGLLKVHREN